MTHAVRSGDVPLSGPTLQVLRVLVALAIFLNHWADGRYDRLIPQTQLAIDFIFFIEGLLAAQLLASRPFSDVRAPVLDRFAKIYPIWIIALGVGVLAALPLAVTAQDGWALDRLAATAILGVLMLPTFGDLVFGAVYPLNSPAWAVAIELVGFVLLCLVWTRLSFRRLLLITALSGLVMLAMALAWYDTNMGWRAHAYIGGLPRMLFGFFGGVLIYAILSRLPGIVPRVSPIVPIVAFAAVQMLDIRLVGLPLLVTAVPLIVLLAAVAREPAFMAAAGRWSARYALGIYLLGSPVLLMMHHVEHALPIPASIADSALGFLVTLAVLVAVTVFLVRAVEEPARRTFSGQLRQRFGLQAA